MLHYKTVIISVLVFLCLILQIVPVEALEVRIDIVGIADFVIDGDTFDVTLSNGTSFRVRLADVNAVELDEVGYAEAREYLKSLVYEKTVYLDVDNLYIYENHGSGDRLVCVVYGEYNTTHLINVNEALFQAGHVELRNYDNEFSPYSWNLFVLKEEVIPEFPSVVAFVIIFIVMLVFMVLSKNTFWDLR